MNSAYSPVEERQKGVYDRMLKLGKERGVYYLGRFDWREEFYVWTTFPISKPEDLRGHKLYVPTGFIEFYPEWGITGVTMPVTELYTAMERGVIEGTTHPLPAGQCPKLERVLRRDCATDARYNSPVFGDATPLASPQSNAPVCPDCGPAPPERSLPSYRTASCRTHPFACPLPQPIPAAARVP